MTFCEVAARVYSRFSRPRSVSLNWFIPALVKSSVGSSFGTSAELGTTRCPRLSKYLRKDARISLEVICGQLNHKDHKGHKAGNLIFVVLVAFVVPLESGQYLLWFEALPDQVPIEPVELAFVGDVRAAAKAL